MLFTASTPAFVTWQSSDDFPPRTPKPATTYPSAGCCSGEIPTAYDKMRNGDLWRLGNVIG